MQPRRTLAIAAFMSAIGSATFAWEHQMLRGLDLYTAPNQIVSLSLVCDPNSVYGSSESALLVQIGSDPFETKDMTFRFGDGMAVQTKLEKGRVAKALIETIVWQSLLDGFRASGAVVIEDVSGSYDVTLGDPMMFSCT